MYHQFDRSMHPRQSILKTILTLKEKSHKAESTLRALEDVSLHLIYSGEQKNSNSYP